jgi:hypothetical protein
MTWKSILARYRQGVAVASFACFSVYAGEITPVTDLPAGDDVIKIKEVGGINLNTQIWPTAGGKRIPDGHGGDAVSQHNLDQPVADNPALGQYTFELSSFFIVNKTVYTTSDYQQKTGDPGTLFASAFVNGVMVNSLADWLNANGFNDGNWVYQPDFLPLPGQPEIFYGVNLADMVTAGAGFVGSHSFGETFTIDSSGKLPELSMYTFSSTPLDYVPGSGWSDATPLAPGTQITYSAFHATTTVPEPASWSTFCAALAAVAAVLRRRVCPRG